MDALIERAEGYPFDLPLDSFVLRAGEVIEGMSCVLSGRTPVLAIGSNGAPAQLLRKFGREGAVIPVTRAILREHAIVHSAHFSSYGSLPATLMPFPGASAYLFVTWLDDAQLARMHESEAVGINYDFTMRDDLPVQGEDGQELPSVGIYASRTGPLRAGGRAIRLAAIAAIGCHLPALTQRAMLRFVHSQLAPDIAYGAFMIRIVEDAGYRAAMRERLAAGLSE